MSFTKIVAGDLTGKGTALLPDIPALTGAQMRTVLEEIVRDVAIVKHNSHIDELEASTSAASIGAVDLASSETTVQALLDTINFSGKTAQTSVTDDDTKIPTSGAIVDYVTALGGGDMQKAIYDTTNSGTVDDSKKLGGVAASSYVSSGTTLWTNPSPTSSFAGQTVTLSETIANFSYYEIEFFTDTISERIITTGKINTLYATRLFSLATLASSRNVTRPSTTSIAFGSGLSFTTYGGAGVVDNNVIIPYKIIGYKSK